MATRKTKCPYCGADGLVPVEKRAGMVVCHSCKKQYDLSKEGETSAVVGALGGALLGAAIFGPVGAIAGGVIGALIGNSEKGVG